MTFHVGHEELILHASDIYFSCIILVFLTLCNDIGLFGNLELITGLVCNLPSATNTIISSKFQIRTDNMVCCILQSATNPIISSKF